MALMVGTRIRVVTTEGEHRNIYKGTLLSIGEDFIALKQGHERHTHIPRERVLHIEEVEA